MTSDGDRRIDKELSTFLRCGLYRHGADPAHLGGMGAVENEEQRPILMIAGRGEGKVRRSLPSFDRHGLWRTRGFRGIQVENSVCIYPAR